MKLIHRIHFSYVEHLLFILDDWDNEDYLKPRCSFFYRPFWARHVKYWYDTIQKTSVQCNNLHKWMIDFSSVPYVIKSDINERDGNSDENTKTEKKLLLKGRKRGVFSARHRQQWRHLQRKILQRNNQQSIIILNPNFFLFSRNILLVLYKYW